MERKHYIDNLRWIAILLLFPFHTAQIWNGGEYSGFYIWSHTNNFMYAFSTAVYPWYMTLLFVIAGISSKYALKKRTNKQFIVERSKKLLIPFVFGVLFLVPVMTYIAEIFFNGYTGSYINQYILFFTKETDLTGYKGGFTPAHLWFLLYLFVISMIALLVIQIQRKRFPKLCVDKFSYGMLILLFIPEWLMLYVLNIGGKSIGQFLMLYLTGYYILSEENILQKLKQYRFISLGLFLISVSAYTYLYCFGNMRNELGTGLFVFFGWTGILTLLGVGQLYLNFHTKLSEYFSHASFPIYIIHQPVLVVVGFFALKMSVGITIQFLLIALLSFTATIVIYEVVGRIPYVSMLFGIDRRVK
ncbi:acyltransferase family protein [Anaerosporobacter sp.]|uniref:acyltransferase family protein n=1 Tax=Anaerosporobacter sp. TaxID=1872529 RepID=UPI00286ED644|nr:acyltransferase family protein [Anaerosporobacter sp.]